MRKSLWLTCTKFVFATTAKECELGQRLARRRLDLDLTQVQSADEAPDHTHPPCMLGIYPLVLQKSMQNRVDQTAE